MKVYILYHDTPDDSELVGIYATHSLAETAQEKLENEHMIKSEAEWKDMSGRDQRPYRGGFLDYASQERWDIEEREVVENE